MLCREIRAPGPDGIAARGKHRRVVHFSCTPVARLCYVTPKRKNGNPMLRLTLILCIGLFAALMIAGEDRGQLRPGLADAAARRPLAGVGVAATADSVAPAAAAESQSRIAAAPAVGTAPAPVVARVDPDPYAAPKPNPVTRVETPVFSLAADGKKAVPATDPQPEVAAGGAGTVWYVFGNAVNVRAEPSTEAAVLGTLDSGEALLVQAVDAEWARIVIQGDGVEGFVALRYLSPEAP